MYVSVCKYTGWAVNNGQRSRGEIFWAKYEGFIKYVSLNVAVEKSRACIVTMNYYKKNYNNISSYFE